MVFEPLGGSWVEFCRFRLLRSRGVPVTGRSWRGSAFGGARGRTDVPKIVDWYMEGKINIDEMITHTMPLSQINDAFDLMHEGKSIRSVVTF